MHSCKANVINNGINKVSVVSDAVPGLERISVLWFKMKAIRERRKTELQWSCCSLGLDTGPHLGLFKLLCSTNSISAYTATGHTT